MSDERAPSSPSPACEACEASSGAFGEGLGVVFFRFVSVLRCFASRCYVTFQILVEETRARHRARAVHSPPVVVVANRRMRSMGLKHLTHGHLFGRSTRRARRQ